MQTYQSRTCLWTLPTTLLGALCLLSLVLAACDDGSTGDFATPFPDTPVPATLENGEATAPTATPAPEELETAVAELRNVPVLSEDAIPGWTQEGEAGTPLTKVCPPAEEGNIFAEKASRPLLGPNGERAGSGDVFFLEQSAARPYTQQLFADAAACSQALAESWLGQDVPFATSGTEPGVGEESFLIPALDVPGAALFLRREEVVAAVIVLGADSERLIQGFAQSLDEQIVEKLRDFTGGQG